MANSYTSMLPARASVDENALFNVSTPEPTSDTGYSSGKASLEVIADAVVNDLEYATSLDTEDKTIAGAINELAAKEVDIVDKLKELKTPKDATITDGVAVIDDADMVEENPLKSLVVSVEGWQEGSGDPSPSNVRPIHGWTGANIGVDPKYGGFIGWNQQIDPVQYRTTFTSNPNITITISGNVWSSTGAWTSGGQFRIHDNPFDVIKNHVYMVYNNPDIYVNESGRYYEIRSSSQSAGLSLNEASGIAKAAADMPNAYLMIWGVVEISTYTITLAPNIFDLTQMFGETIANYIYSLEQAEAGAGVAYFKNIFPKDYYEYNAGETSLVSKVNGDEYGLYPISWQTEAGEIYSGTLDVTNGVLTAEWGYIASYAGESLPSAWISDRDVYAQGTTPTIGAEVAYELATPTEYQLTPTQVAALIEKNNIFADCGAVTECKYKNMATWSDYQTSTANSDSNTRTLNSVLRSVPVTLNKTALTEETLDTDTAEDVIETEEETEEVENADIAEK